MSVSKVLTTPHSSLFVCATCQTVAANSKNLSHHPSCGGTLHAALLGDVFPEASLRIRELEAELADKGRLTQAPTHRHEEEMAAMRRTLADTDQALREERKKRIDAEDALRRSGSRPSLIREKA